ncbi:GMC family oxidoreductase [Paraburkholderia solisilvae]|nr:GMC family oxidoreductase N-terminal domain-containing protein [Paraburkholderia solisilvae]
MILTTASASASASAPVDTYDHIVIGAGPSGCVLAARLSEQSGRRVLLLEEGGAGIERTSIEDPDLWRTNLATDIDWQYSTTPQPKLDGRRIIWNRGKVLGGSSTINAMAWVWGQQADFDGWAAAGNVGWDFASLEPEFQRIETSLPQRGRGTSGPMPLYSIPSDEPLVKAFLASCEAAGHDVLANACAPVRMGAGTNELNITNGARFSAVHAYLLPAMQRKNLTVLTNSAALELVFDGLRCVGVRCNVNGTYRMFRSSEDVALCAGAIESPRLLALSGIGNATDLRRLGIDVVADLPGVGLNLQDHCVVRAYSTTHTPQPRSRLDAHLYLNSKGTSPIPDIEVALLRGATTGVLASDPASSYALLACLLRPRSRGEIALRSSDNRVPLDINPNYLSEAADVDALCEATRIAADLGNSSPFAPWRKGDETAAPSTKREIEAYMRRSATTYWHPAGTCAMGTGVCAVVDPMLSVRGVSNLRIADASIMPTIPTGNTLAPTLVVAERAARLILAQS